MLLYKGHTHCSILWGFNQTRKYGPLPRPTSPSAEGFSHIFFFFRQKLDGVGPVDNRPSTDKLHHFVPPPKKNHVTHEM